MTEESIHLLQDLEMYSMLERCIRGGLTFVNRHFAERKTFVAENGKKQTIHLAYFDQSNLYGSSLSKQLPYRDFSWKIQVNSQVKSQSST